MKLSDLRGIDISITYWGSAYIAHPIVSFWFGGDNYVAASIETRKEVGEGYSAVRGFFRQYELIYLFADERDIVRLRTNFRTGEDVYLYRTIAKPEWARKLFIEYIRQANLLRETTGVVQRLDAQLHHRYFRLDGQDWPVAAKARHAMIGEFCSTAKATKCSTKVATLPVNCPFLS